MSWGKKTRNIFMTCGATSHTDKQREDQDYYATDPSAAAFLLELETFENILEPACGEGHLSKVFINAGIDTTSSDIIDRGFGDVDDFFNKSFWDGDIVTNPPYKYAQKFIEHALQIIPKGRKVAMFLKLQFLEGRGRKKLFTDNPPKILYVSSSRILTAKNADFEGMKRAGGSAIAYGWYVWEKGHKGDTIIKWFN